MSNDDDERRDVTDDANDVYDSMRAMVRAMPSNNPGPYAYRILGNLKLAGGSMLRDALNKMSDGLSRSLIDFDNYMDDKSDPAAAVLKAKEHLARAARFAEMVGQELEMAQSEIASLGYRTPGDVGYRAPEDRQ